MSVFTEQKARKLTIYELAQEKLNGNLLREFNEFLEFLRGEEAKFVLCAANKYSANYKGNGIAVIAIHEQNMIRIEIYTGEKDNLDEYLDEQTNEIVDLFMERINSKCRQCRPTCGCSRGPGFTYTVLGNEYKNICHGALGYAFANSDDNIQTLTLFVPGADRPGPPPIVRSVPIETVKNLILAKKKYVGRTK